MTPRTRPFIALPRHRRGAALVIGLVLLTILTLLAAGGIGTAATELVLAGNEQYRRSASMAASAGIEHALAALATVPTVPGAAPTIVSGVLDLSATGVAVNHYDTATRYVGDEQGLPGSSIGRFVGLHYEIDSRGRSARDAHEQQFQGVMVIAAAGGAARVGRVGGGLGEAGE